MNKDFNGEGINEDLFDESKDKDVQSLTTEEGSNPQEKEDRSTKRFYAEEDQDNPGEGDEDSDEAEDYFGDDDDQEGEEGEEEDYELSETANMLNYLNASGYIALPEDFDVSAYSDEDLGVIMENSLNHSIQSRVEDSFNSLPPIVRELASYAHNGGDVAQFFEAIAQSHSVGANINIEDPTHQEYVIRNTLASQGFDENYISSQIQFLSQTNNLANHAKAYYAQAQQQKVIEAQNLAEEQRQAEMHRIESIRQSKMRMQSFLNQNEAIGAIRLSSRDKSELVSYMTDEAYELEDGTRISSLQKDLYYEIMENHALAMQVALLLKNKGKDGLLDFSFIEKQASTKMAKRVKEGLRRTDRKAPSSSSKKVPSYKTKSLADLID